jgi:hypothetical protein
MSQIIFYSQQTINIRHLSISHILLSEKSSEEIKSFNKKIPHKFPKTKKLKTPKKKYMYKN